MAKIRRAFARLYLWIGERFGLIHYRNCHDCVYRADCSDPNLVLCELDWENRGVIVFTEPCEAVWCDGFIEKFGKEH